MDRMARWLIRKTGKSTCSRHPASALSFFHRMNLLSTIIIINCCKADTVKSRWARLGQMLIFNVKKKRLGLAAKAIRPLLRCASFFSFHLVLLFFRWLEENANGFFATTQPPVTEYWWARPMSTCSRNQSEKSQMEKITERQRRIVIRAWGRIHTCISFTVVSAFFQWEFVGIFDIGIDTWKCLPLAVRNALTRSEKEESRFSHTHNFHVANKSRMIYKRTDWIWVEV